MVVPLSISAARVDCGYTLNALRETVAATASWKQSGNVIDVRMVAPSLIIHAAEFNPGARRMVSRTADMAAETRDAVSLT